MKESQIYVYVMSAKKSGAAPNKIGYTRNIGKRVRSMQTYHCTKVKVHYKMQCSNISRCKRLEAAIHHHLSDKRIRGEWFNLSATECESKIREIAETYRGMSVMEIDKAIGKRVGRCEHGCKKNCNRGCN